MSHPLVKIVALLWLCSCSMSSSGGPAEALRAAEIARAIDANPDRAEEILADQGLSVEELEAMMFRIAEDPELTRAYEEARQ